jgi:hypothetical protein
MTDRIKSKTTCGDEKTGDANEAERNRATKRQGNKRAFMAHRRESEERMAQEERNRSAFIVIQIAEANLPSPRNRTPIQDLVVLFGQTATDDGFGLITAF